MAARYHFDDILGESEAITRAVENARQLAASEGAVMITEKAARQGNVRPEYS